jgi:hypothetical protein
METFDGIYVRLFVTGCPRNSSSSVSCCAHGYGVRPIAGNSHTRSPFGRLREPRSALTQRCAFVRITRCLAGLTLSPSRRGRHLRHT